MLPDPQHCRIGLIGTGFVAQGFARLLARVRPQWPLSAVLTRRALDTLPPSLAPYAISAQDPERFFQRCDLVVECSGDISHATDFIVGAIAENKPVVTMHCEWHVTVGSALSYPGQQGLVTEAEGDQPGSLAALKEELELMGFTPWVYGNIKGFLNHTPTPEEMAFWAQKNGISLRQTTAFTDGTKLQFEQALVANGLGASILQSGLTGTPSADWQACIPLAEAAQNLGLPVADYLLAPALPPGIFITATHQSAEASALAYLKQGPGPFYTLHRPYHLCQYEILKTIQRILERKKPLLHNSAHPSIGIRAIAKVDLKPGQKINNAIGSFVLRGEAVKIREVPEHIPLGLIQNAEIIRPIKAGSYLTPEDVEVPDSLALKLGLASYEQARKLA